MVSSLRLRAAALAPAYWWFGGLCAAAALFLVLLGEGFRVGLFAAGHLLGLLLLWGTWRLTRPQPAEGERRALKGWQLGGQLAVVGVVIVITGASFGAFGLSVPGWSELVAWVYGLGERTLSAEWVGGPGNALANPLQYFVIPLILLLLLGARLPDVGLGRGYRAGRVSLLWLALPAALLVVMLVLGQATVQVAVRRFLGNALQNGFFEEFLFRGALQTRLGYLMGPASGLVLQALLFGLWHLGGNLEMMGGSWAGGLAVCVLSQGVSGLIYGLVFRRTRNLLAPACAHIGMNVVGQAVAF